MRTRNTPHSVASLLENTSPDGECLIWQGAGKPNGYGVAVYRGKQSTVHRIMYQLHNQTELGDHMEVDHICNNRRCINPEHLEAVTHQENMKRGIDRRTHCRAGHEWNEDNTYLATVKRRQGGTRYQRYCRVCRAKHQADLRERRKAS